MRASSVEVVEQRAALGVEPQVPDPLLVADLLHRLDRDFDLEEVPHPGLEHPAERVEPGAAEVQHQRRVVALVPGPVERGVRLVEHVELDRAQRRLGLHHQLAERAEAAGGGVHLHGLRVGRHDRSVLEDHLLLAEQQLGGARPQAALGPVPGPVRAALQQAAQDHVDHLIEEQRRHLRGPAA
jgi:hypothetical protein